MLTRRIFLGSLAGALAASEIEPILSRIKPPVFPKRDFNIRRYGAKAGTDATAAIRDAIAACAKVGGGRVVVPAGTFPTGAIHLRSNVHLYLSAGATLQFSRDPRAYLPVVFTRWEGMECMNYSPFIYAHKQENIAITGLGTLDGQADVAHWWPWKGQTRFGWKSGDPHQAKARDALAAMVERGVPPEDRVFGEGSCLRPQFIQPCRSKNVLIEGVTIVNSPMWEIHPLLCNNVTVRNVKVVSHGPNNDGCNPECCRDVLIEGCLFDTGDDCIAIKSGRNRDGRRVGVPTEFVVVRKCTMKDGHGGVTIGSEMSGDVRDVYVEDCVMDSPNLDRALRIKTNAVRGGTVERVRMRNVTVGTVSDSIVHVDFLYEEGAAGPERPVVRDIEMTGVTSKKSRRVLFLRGLPNAKISDIRISSCTFENVAGKDVLEHVEALKLSNVKVNGRDAA
jgi:polygalacturonase